MDLTKRGTYDNDTNARIIRSGDVIHISGFLKMSDERAAVEAANNGSVPANTTGQFHIEGTNQTVSAFIATEAARARTGVA